MSEATPVAAPVEPSPEPRAIIRPPTPLQRLVKRLLEIQQYSFTGFDTLGQVKDALRQLDMGRFDLPTQLVHAMTRDDRVAGALDLRCIGVDALPLVFKEGEGRLAPRARDQIGKRWNVMFPKEELQKLRRWGRMLGIGVAENRWVFDPETQQVEPRLYTWNPRFLWWNQATRSYWMSAQDQVVELTPNTGQWVLYAPYGLYEAWNYGLVRSLYVAWLLRQWSLRDSGRYGEAYGSVTKKARYPAALEDEEADDFMSDVAALGSESSIGLPSVADNNGNQQYDVEFMELKGTGGDLFEKLIGMASTNIAIRIVGNNLTTEVKAGSYAAAVVHDNIRSDIIQDDTDSLSVCLKEQSVDFWALYNYGRKDIAPRPMWDSAPPSDKKLEGDGLKSIAEGIGAAVREGIPIDAQKICEANGVPLREDATDDEKRKPLPIDPLLLKVGVPTVNEARMRLNQKPLEGGDELPAKQAADAASAAADAAAEDDDEAEDAPATTKK